MCGRFTLFSSEKELEERFEIQLDVPLEKSYNIAPTQTVLGIVADQEERQAMYFRWGLIPFWAKDRKIGNKLINARAETIHEKPSFRHLIKRKRCLIPSDGFFEWKRIGDKKQPYFIRLKDGSPFAFAGLWDVWADGGQEVQSCTIITTQPNQLMKSIHNRMPVIFNPEQEENWLDESLTDTRALQSLLQPYSEQKMDAYPVSTMVNSPRNNQVTIIERSL